MDKEDVFIYDINLEEKYIQNTEKIVAVTGLSEEDIKNVEINK